MHKCVNYLNQVLRWVSLKFGYSGNNRKTSYSHLMYLSIFVQTCDLSSSFVCIRQHKLKEIDNKWGDDNKMKER